MSRFLVKCAAGCSWGVDPLGRPVTAVWVTYAACPFCGGPVKAADPVENLAHGSAVSPDA